ALKDFGNAVECFNKAIQLEPKNPGALFGLGQIIYRTNPTKAVEYFKMCLQVTPTSAGPLVYLSHYYLIHGNPSMGIEFATAGLNVAADNRQRAMLLTWRAIARVTSGGSIEGATSDFEEALQIGPDLPGVLENFSLFRKIVETVQKPDRLSEITKLANRAAAFDPAEFASGPSASGRLATYFESAVAAC
ncbi:MAG: tetratricopeptide repeat protein, partial [Tepidisphaeraceae bacterium]